MHAVIAPVAAIGVVIIGLAAVAYFAVQTERVRQSANRENRIAQEKLDLARHLATMAALREEAAQDAEASAQRQLLESASVLTAAQREREARTDPRTVLRDLIRDRERWPDGRFKAKDNQR